MAYVVRKRTVSKIQWCLFVGMGLIVFPHQMATVAATSSVSGQSPAVIHPLITPLTTTTRTPISLSECDRMYISNPDGPKNGTFSAPLFKKIQEDHSRQCVYTFIAAENERVRIQFTEFDLRGQLPECNYEYIDLYMEVEDPSTDLIDTPFGGRICGKNLPTTRISMYQTFVVSFYTEDPEVNSNIFGGIYDFIDATQFVVGTPTPNTVCSFTVYSDRKKEGEFLSPTYPGVYPKDLQCEYKFLGRKGQRVRLEFMDFDLFYGGSHCPFDYMKIYDGSSIENMLIGTYCGQQRSLVVYSSTENLYVQFITLQRTAQTANRGFSAYFEFSEKFINLDFIDKNNAEHMRGTECDQKILSKKGSQGNVYSPNYPFPYHAHVVCRYYIYGLQDTQNLEKVKLDFEKFEIPSNDNECTDGQLKIYLQGQEERSAVEEFDHMLCGQDIPSTIISEGPRLVMVFNSGSSQGIGFKAKYSFETDYKIPGTAKPDGSCTFTYLSESDQTGDFNSPRYPSNYPSHTECEYVFLGKPEEQVKFVFNYFRTKTQNEISGYNEKCEEDWLEIYEILPSGREQKLGRYCGRTTPGPVVSDPGIYSMKVLLSTDNEGVASGFSATYTFFNGTNKPEDCGQVISGQEDGIITSPGFPARYEAVRQVCKWHITVRPNHRILLFFDSFVIEGDPFERGCPGAVVRIWQDLGQPPLELCGEIKNDTREIISSSTNMKLAFITAAKSTGSAGFHATWTEIKEGPSCEQFHCKSSGFCISEKTKCNNRLNCGKNDNSDEFDCVHDKGINIYLIVGLTVGSAFLVSLILCAVCHRKRKRRRQPDTQFEQRPKPPSDIPIMSFVAVDSV